MADLDGVMKELSDMMKTVGATQMASDLIRSYDNYALMAMQALIQSNSTMPDTVKDVAQHLAAAAWRIADAMMNERKKRGIGGV